MRQKYHHFLQKNRNKGIPNLMLYICLGNVLLYLYVLLTNDFTPANYLTFDIGGIFRGEIWRCFTWLFTYGINYINSPLGMIYIIFFVMFYRWLGQVLEDVWGTLRLNIYYFGGAILTVFAGILIALIFKIEIVVSVYYLNLSLLLAVATLVPEHGVMLFGIIPLKMRWLAILDVVLILFDIFSLVKNYSGTLLRVLIVMVATAPAASILNYVLTFGKDVSKLLPFRSTFKQQKRRQKFQKAAQPNPDWAKNYRSNTGERPYRHRCTVCGRTDTDHPELEFRYCSRCKGYFCYCIEHISNHTHVE